MSALVLGVNFGATASSVAILTSNGQAEVIADDDGFRQIANAVSFTDEEEYIGVPGRKQLVRNNLNTVLRFRDLLGKDFDAVKAFQAPLQAAPLVSKNGQPAFEVQIQGKKTVLTASEIVTKFLKTLYGFATDFLGRKPDHAVFAVPAYFDEAQKSALKDASKAAGVEISQLISAEGAAALAYGLTTSPSNSSFAIGDRNVLFLDVGGSSTTASLVAVRSGLLAPLASVRDDKLGGDDIDAKLVDYMSKEFIKKNKALKWDPSNHRAVAKLFLEAEVTKRSLSASTSATCAVESLMDGVDFSTTINRTRFDLLCGSIYQSIVDKALEAIEKAGLDPVQVHEVVLMGATTKLPSLVSRIQDLFSEKTLVNSQIDPDEVVAKGCALQAELILNTPSSAPVDVAIAEKASASGVAALSKPLGLLLGGSTPDKGRFALLLDQNSPLPARKTIEVSIPAGDKSAKVGLSLWEGAHSVQVDQPATNGKKSAKKDDESEDEDDEPTRTPVLKAETLIANLAVPVDASPLGKGRSAEPAKVRITLIVGEGGGQKGVLSAQQVVGKGGETFSVAF